MSIDKRIIGYVVANISQFAELCDIDVRRASNYLSEHKGIDFLIEHYQAEHLLSIDDSVQDLVKICRNNGGEL